MFSNVRGLFCLVFTPHTGSTEETLVFLQVQSQQSPTQLNFQLRQRWGLFLLQQHNNITSAVNVPLTINYLVSCTQCLFCYLAFFTQSTQQHPSSSYFHLQTMPTFIFQMHLRHFYCWAPMTHPGFWGSTGLPLIHFFPILFWLFSSTKLKQRP